MNMRLMLIAAFGVLLGCGGSGKRAPADPATATAAAAAAVTHAGDVSAAEGSANANAMPKDCASRDADVCMPDGGFVKRMCNGSFSDVALRFFAGGTPWTRGYLTRDVDGWNAEGGSAARARLAFNEEVVLLRRRLAPKGGMQVSGGGGAGYLVLRVDGSCYTVDDLEVTRKRPPKPKSGPVTFRYLDAATQDALLKNPRIEAAYTKRRKECKGASSGDVTKPCEAADTDLARVVPDEVRRGIELPSPKVLP